MNKKELENKIIELSLLLYEMETYNTVLCGTPILNTIHDLNLAIKQLYELKVEELYKNEKLV